MVTACRAGGPAVLLLLVAAALAGCAIGPVGAIAGRVTDIDGGWMLEVYTLGAHVRTGDDPGVDLGAAKRTYLFAQDESVTPRGGWHLLWLPPVSGQAMLRVVESVGIDLHLGHPEPGVTAGFQRVAATRPVPMGGDVFREIRFSLSSPNEACLSTRWERSC